jgi:hypothetical protein
MSCSDGMAIGTHNIAFGNFHTNPSKTYAIGNHFGYGLMFACRIAMVKFQCQPVIISTVDALRILQN